MSDSAEQTLLRRSILATVVVGATGIVFGLLSGSLSIIFDGVFSAVDASMTALALMVSRLIARDVSNRFQMGFWHIEPMVLAANGSLLILLSFYAFLNAVGLILAGGRELEFGWAMIYAGLVASACFAMAFTSGRGNRAVGSSLVALDVKGWVMSGLISTALLLAFVAASLVDGTAYDWMRPYADPVILAVLTLVIIPVPVRTVREAVADIFLMAPGDLDRTVRTVAELTVERHALTGFRSYVAKVGRSRMIEIHFIVPRNWPVDSIAALDAIRQEVANGIGDKGGHARDRWLTIAFTGDERWAT